MSLEIKVSQGGTNVSSAFLANPGGMGGTKLRWVIITEEILPYDACDLTGRGRPVLRITVHGFWGGEWVVVSLPANSAWLRRVRGMVSENG